LREPSPGEVTRLYVFRPFLKLIVIASVAPVTFGASLSLVILTVLTASAIYRLVMNWVTDGRGQRME